LQQAIRTGAVRTATEEISHIVISHSMDNQERQAEHPLQLLLLLWLPRHLTKFAMSG
jgi:hypothetical protein